jgi:hypothetical protein
MDMDAFVGGLQVWAILKNRLRSSRSEREILSDIAFILGSITRDQVENMYRSCRQGNLF